jgi:hypothetical protein
MNRVIIYLIFPDWETYNISFFFCAGVVYSGEYDVYNLMMFVTKQLLAMQLVFYYLKESLSTFQHD